MQSTPFLPTLLLQKFIELYVKYEAFIYQHWRFDVRIASKMVLQINNVYTVQSSFCFPGNPYACSHAFTRLIHEPSEIPTLMLLDVRLSVPFVIMKCLRMSAHKIQALNGILEQIFVFHPIIFASKHFL